MKRSIALSLFILLLNYLILIHLVYGEPEINDFIDKITYIEMQISAIATNMYGILRWSSQDIDSIKDASKKSIKRLDDIRNYLVDDKAPTELTELKEDELFIVDKLKGLYYGIENKKPEEVDPEVIKIGGYHARFTKKLMKVFADYRQMENLSEDFNPLDEEIKLIQDENDRLAYRRCTNLIKNKQYKVAYNSLDTLRNKYEDSVFADCVVLKMSDCLLMTDSDLRDVTDDIADVRGLRLLSNILEKNRYSPVLYDTFYKWRTITQYSYGMSNKAEIPNYIYNEKRWDITQIIKKYLRDNPDDKWARFQIDLLLTLPNIRRSGDFGNDNITHWGLLYLDAEL